MWWVDVAQNSTASNKPSTNSTANLDRPIRSGCNPSLVGLGFILPKYNPSNRKMLKCWSLGVAIFFPTMSAEGSRKNRGVRELVPPLPGFALAFGGVQYLGHKLAWIDWSRFHCIPTIDVDCDDTYRPIESFNPQRCHCLTPTLVACWWESYVLLCFQKTRGSSEW